MDKTIQKLISFLENNPNSNKEAIAEATGLKGLTLFNTLKRLVKEGTINEDETGSEKLYSAAMIDDGKPNLNPPEEQNEDAEVTSKGRDNSKYTFNGQEYYRP